MGWVEVSVNEPVFLEEIPDPSPSGVAMSCCKGLGGGPSSSGSNGEKKHPSGSRQFFFNEIPVGSMFRMFTHILKEKTSTKGRFLYASLMDLMGFNACVFHKQITQLFNKTSPEIMIYWNGVMTEKTHGLSQLFLFQFQDSSLMDTTASQAGISTPHLPVTYTSWWFQPLWKILVKMEIFPK